MNIDELINLLCVKAEKAMGNNNDTKTLVIESIGEIKINSIEYQVQVTLDPRKDKWIDKNVTTIRVDMDKDQVIPCANVNKSDISDQLTYLGYPIHKKTRGIVYLCDYDHQNKTIKVIGELMFNHPTSALEAYANIPNPESQMAYGWTFEEFIEDLNKLHMNMNDPIWLKELGDRL